MWQLTLIGSGLATALVGATAFGLPSPESILAMNAQAAPTSVGPTTADSAIARSPDGLFYVTASSPSGDVRMLVDTGASHVVLSHEDARKLGARRQTGKHSTIATAAGTIEADWVDIAKLAINGHVLRDVRAAVPRLDVQTSLLGQNALAQFNAIRIEGDQLLLVR